MAWVEVDEPYAKPPKLGSSSAAFTEADLDAFEDDPIELTGARLSNLDLSQRRIEHIRQSRVEGSKLMGFDASRAGLIDVVFESCTIRQSLFRMSRLKRVAFIDCVLDDVDFFETELTDVDFIGSELNRVNIDRVTAERVDLRGARSMDFIGLNAMAGYVIDESQLALLAPQLALNAGFDIERAVRG